MREQGEKKTELGNEEHLPNDNPLFPKGSGMKISMWAYREKIQPRNNCISRAAFLLNLASFEFRDQLGKIATNRLKQYKWLQVGEEGFEKQMLAKYMFKANRDRPVVENKLVKCHLSAITAVMTLSLELNALVPSLIQSDCVFRRFSTFTCKFEYWKLRYDWKHLEN